MPGLLLRRRALGRAQLGVERAFADPEGRGGVFTAETAPQGRPNEGLLDVGERRWQRDLKDVGQ